MPRMRVIKPQFWTNEQLSRCSLPSRLLFIGLWNFCDDRGVHVANAYTLRTEVFPGEHLTNEQVASMIGELIREGLVAEFTANGKSWWYVTGWVHQRIDNPSRTLLPAPPVNSRNTPIALPEDSASPPRVLPERSTKELEVELEVEGELENVCSTDPASPAAEPPASEPASPSEAPASEPDDPTVLTFPTRGTKREWHLRQSRVDRLREHYPGMDVLHQARRALAWCESQPPNKRKTPNGMPQFLNRWMDNEANKAPANFGRGPPQSQAMGMTALFPPEGLTDD